MKRRVRDNTILFENDLLVISYFISDVLWIILNKKKWGSEKERARKGYLLRPEEHEELLHYVGKSLKKQNNVTSQISYEGESSENSIRPIKHRSMRTQ
ncbi:hypothetical protein [Aestuariibaculum suncheonense]|uniref:Uncharacterized protein n=1 Tax=Aestuariibaculum suncheonense TaxID=1028745 RepID=A0A8J6Q3U2_9FLAO|nr:hypothetical protein [Aestuariibaculum suncheonense]MBD0833921.1 hypothetical protein [Aestuariibaculum suncheonense]